MHQVQVRQEIVCVQHIMSLHGCKFNCSNPISEYCTQLYLILCVIRTVTLNSAGVVFLFIKTEQIRALHCALSMAHA
jgi:hypothetical protein